MVIEVAGVAEDLSITSDIGDREQSDKIAELLVGDSIEDTTEGKGSPKKIEEEKKESEEESSGEEDSGDEETEESTEESKLEEISKDEDTWESILGVEEGKLNFDEEGNLAGVNIKVDGETSTINMTNLIAGYQNNKSNTNKSQALAEERKTFDNEFKEVVELYKTKLSDVDAMNQYLEKQLVSDFEGVNWQELRATDPAEYAALKQDYAARANDIQSIKDTIKQVNSQESDKLTNQFNDKMKVNISEQRDKMILNNPTWADKDVLQKNMTELNSFIIKQYGFTDEEFKSISDSRLVEVIKDASKYHAGISLATKKLSKKVPKFQKSAGQPSKKVTKLQKLTAAAGKAKGAQKRDLQASAVAELLTGG